MTTLLNCACQSAVDVTKYDWDHIVKRFEAVREECPALKKILVPDDIWNSFEKAAKGNFDSARHRARVLLALKFGYLHKLTSPIHKYLLDDSGNPKQNIKKQYLKDLREQWIFNYEEIIESHRHSRMYAGKLTELMVAEWLEHEGLYIKVDKLEALEGCNDIEARTPYNVDAVIEVKTIGTDDNDFLELVAGISDKQFNKGKRTYHNDRINYLLFRIYEAASQLKKRIQPSKKIVIIVLESTQFGLLKCDIKDTINWKSPQFMHEHLSCKGKHFFKEHCFNIKDKLSETIQCITDLRIVEQDSDYNYSVVFCFP